MAETNGVKVNRQLPLPPQTRTKGSLGLSLEDSKDLPLRMVGRKEQQVGRHPPVWTMDLIIRIISLQHLRRRPKSALRSDLLLTQLKSSTLKYHNPYKSLNLKSLSYTKTKKDNSYNMKIFFN